MDPYKRVFLLLAEIVKDGCLPEFDYYYDDFGKGYWVCSFHEQGSFTIGVDPKTTAEADGMLELLQQVAGKLGFEE